MLNINKKIILVLIIVVILVAGCKDIIKPKTTTTTDKPIATILTTTTVSTIKVIPKERSYCDNSTDCIASLKMGCVNGAWYGYKNDWDDKKRTFTCTCYNHRCLSEVIED